MLLTLLSLTSTVGSLSLSCCAAVAVLALFLVGCFFSGGSFGFSPAGAIGMSPSGIAPGWIDGAIAIVPPSPTTMPCGGSGGVPTAPTGTPGIPPGTPPGSATAPASSFGFPFPFPLPAGLGFGVVAAPPSGLGLGGLPFLAGGLGVTG